jgi:hypothetical protein
MIWWIWRLFHKGYQCKENEHKFKYWYSVYADGLWGDYTFYKCCKCGKEKFD